MTPNFRLGVYDRTSYGDPHVDVSAPDHVLLARADEPPRQLKGFEKVELKPGESKSVHFTLNRDALSAWDATVRQWHTYDGTYAVEIGSSSRGIRARGSFLLGARWLSAERRVVEDGR